ncbi:hypothetical protein P8452_19444 [Trifolium repens]|nr:hypothetical protein P8452_19441 [Trifolium repens]WJX30957.1 hypothetical protein P8452_19442 [Trifolium repens]WJX30958.1 hypothetical protein P8452_19443 [Trifolium repens]WJX30959.1 hypothetical protein P8452_19444 [Trifolium repens]
MATVVTEQRKNKTKNQDQSRQRHPQFGSEPRPPPESKLTVDSTISNRNTRFAVKERPQKPLKRRTKTPL